MILQRTEYRAWHALSGSKGQLGSPVPWMVCLVKSWGGGRGSVREGLQPRAWHLLQKLTAAF